jgi:uncharacterized protein YndB with AHSA1/START domain
MEAEIPGVSSGCEIVNSRVINASREKVFKAWTDPAILQRWWGPAGFTNTFHEFDLRPGGRWRFIMHGPDKGNYSNECVFVRIEKPTLIVWDRISNPRFLVVVSFEELSVGKTKVIFRMQFANETECNKVKGFAPQKNEENLDRLEMELLDSDNWQSK